MSNKFWSILFGVTMAAAFLLFVVAPIAGWWLPKSISSFAPAIDGLFYLILGITGFFFVLTEALLVYFMYVYAGQPRQEGHVFGHHYAEEKVMWTSFFKRTFRPVTALIHDQHRLELTWTLIPGLILLLIAIAQVPAWARIKYQNNMPQPDGTTLQMDVKARQWEWRVRYPSADRLTGWEANPAAAAAFGHEPHPDDVHVVNEIHTWKGPRVLVHLRTQDVLHSFFIPNARIKQDALPGKVIPVWFDANQHNTQKITDPATGQPRWVEIGYNPQTGKADNRDMIWEVACAEFCGARHSMMRGKLYVHETRDDFLDWLRHAGREQQRRTTTKAP